MGTVTNRIYSTIAFNGAEEVYVGFTNNMGLVDDGEIVLLSPTVYGIKLNERLEETIFVADFIKNLFQLLKEHYEGTGEEVIYPCGLVYCGGME